MDSIKIGLLGLGVVGSGVWKVIKKNSRELTECCGKEIVISKILVKNINKKRNVNVPSRLLTLNFDDILEDDDIDIIVEVIGGIDPARDYILKAISKNKHIVTANKQLLATHGEEIFKKAAENNVKVFYEASVAGGIPIINAIRESLTSNRIEEIIGIVNGTTNYILSKMTDESSDFEDALIEAKNKGYAEAVPTSDIEGFDAAYKLCILSSLAFKTSVNINSIPREGITKITQDDIKFAKNLGYTIKLLAVARYLNQGLELRVHPAMIPCTSPLAHISDCYNGIIIKGNAAGNLMFQGKGAGELPTASAVVADIISVISNKKALSANYRNNISRVLSLDEIQGDFYVRLNIKNNSDTPAKIKDLLSKNNIKAYSITENKISEDESVILFTVSNVSYAELNYVLNEFKSLNLVHEIGNIIKIEDYAA